MSTALSISPTESRCGVPARQFEAYPTQAAADAWYQRLTASASQVDVNDALYSYDASSDYNPSPDLEKIKAKPIVT